MLTSAPPYRAELFDTQQLLFDRTQPVAEEARLPEDYYDRGWTVINGVSDHHEALAVMKRFIGSIDPSRIPLHERFYERVQLGKADQIPVCADVQASSYQVLHFDMGHPFSEGADPLFVSHVGVYHSPARQREVKALNNLAANNGTPPVPSTPVPTAKTRILSLEGLSSLPAAAIDTRLAEYADAYGDGWAEHNSGRIAAGVRLLDALSIAPTLQDQKDKTVGQWFNNGVKVDGDAAFEQEAAFFAEHDVELEELESRILLGPGQLLILDNTRVLHGRIGQRRPREVFNFMFGIEAISADDIQALRQYMGHLLSGASQIR